MESGPQAVQLALASTSYANALAGALRRERSFQGWRVLPVETPDFGQAGVIVVDDQALDRLALPLPQPERVVLISGDAPACLNRAWSAGIVSVVGRCEPLNTAMLAILAARVRAAASRSAPSSAG